MKAVLRSRYGPPDVLEVKDVEKPSPNDLRGVLVRIHVASANAGDWRRVRASPFLVRLSDGWRRPKNPALGSDIAGRVETVTGRITRFRPGDEVFGLCPGGFAEYGVAREDRLALKPANCSFEEAAAVPVAGLTALQALRNKGHIRAGHKVLVNGASSGVGTFAVQMAKSFGAEVTGVCSTRNLDMVRSIGADHVIDYTKEDFARTGQRYDLICDIVAHHSVSEYRRMLNPHGTCVIVGFGDKLLRRLLYFAIVGRLMSVGGKKIVFFIANGNEEDMTTLKELLETGKIVPVIDRRYPLSDTAEAIRYLEQGHACGKVIITVEGAAPEDVRS